jgi:GLPGLI family protein
MTSLNFSRFATALRENLSKQFIIFSFCIGSLLIPNCYKTTYAGTYILHGQTFSLDIDSSTSAYFNKIDTNWKSSVMERFASKITLKIEVNSKDSVSDIKLQIEDLPAFVDISNFDDKLKIVNMRIYSWKGEKWIYKVDTINNCDLKLTGNSKFIFNHKSSEAVRLLDGSPQTLWICSELPSTINPGLYCNIPGAILEWYDKNNHCKVESIRPCD